MAARPGVFENLYVFRPLFDEPPIIRDPRLLLLVNEGGWGHSLNFLNELFAEADLG